ncbi:hypothetical protein BD626DRAFT_579571 [Schizophyllum amplum]|uniref:Uncharacterized protein n=1 Tax=Schizophyllum amplum TaxID=97359 RepID=A0A550BRB9_9AGAR|nr:hypothetical protein BD626DRAFT_579571 [Auriculariopsis ampla]
MGCGGSAGRPSATRTRTRDLILPMTTWLRRQEAVDRFSCFLDFAQNGALSPTLWRLHCTFNIRD